MERTDPRGPIATPGMRPVLRPDGVEVPGFSWTPPDVAPPTAAWIGVASDGPMFRARKAFDLGAVPKTAWCQISADRSYRLWVNGRLASRGPDDIGMDYHRIQNDRWLVDVRDIGPLLRRGRNVLAVEVFGDPLIGWEGSRGRAGLLLELRAGRTVVRTDSTWRAAPGGEWDRSGGHWVHDPGAETPGWREAELGSSWPDAVVLEDRWLPREPSRIPQRAEIVRPPVPGTRWPLELKAGGDRVAVRYGMVLPAYVGVEVEGGAGGTLWIEPNEPDAPGYNRRFGVRLTGGRVVVEAPFMDSFSVVNLRLEGTAAPARVLDVRASEVAQPVAWRGAFSSSDPDLDRLWRVCRRVTHICLQTHHLDSPHHQEPISDPGDYLIASLVNYGAFFQPWLTRQDARKYAGILRASRNRVFHTSYALLWLRMVVDHTLHTGDLTLERELAPEIHALMETFTGYRGKDGLISEAPNYMFLDWVDIAGFPGHHPPAAIGQGYLTAFTIRALEDAAGVARRSGDLAHARRWDRIRIEMTAAFERVLWDASRGQYRDGIPFRSSVPPGDWLPADTAVESHSAHVNILAVLCGIAPEGRRRDILLRALDGPTFTCQPYFMHFVFEAMDRAGCFDERAPGQLRRWKVIESTGTLREMWDRGDLSHSWGATPLHQCQARILGVEPLEPGYARLRIRPRRAGLSRAAGIVPTPRGDVRVAWTDGPEGFRIEATIPEGLLADIELPGGTIHRGIGAGRHRFRERPKAG